MLLQDFAPAYLIDFKAYCKVLLRVRKMSPLRACPGIMLTNLRKAKKLKELVLLKTKSLRNFFISNIVMTANN